MSRGVIVDSSVVVKWFKSGAEERRDEAFALLERHESGELVLAAPTHLRLEVLNALWAAKRDCDDLRLAARALAEARIEWHEVDADLAAEASQVAARSYLTVYDAVFVALAIQLDAELITADRRLAECTECAVRFLGE